MSSQQPIQNTASPKQRLPLGCVIGVGIFVLLLAPLAWSSLAPVRPSKIYVNEIQVWERKDQTVWVIAQVTRRDYRDPVASPSYLDRPIAVVVATYSPKGRISSHQTALAEKIRQEMHSLFWWNGKLYFDSSFDGQELCEWRSGNFVRLNNAEASQLIKDMGCDTVTSREWYGCIDRASREDGAKLLLEVDQAMQGELYKALGDSVIVSLEPRGSAARLTVSGTSPAGPWKDVILDTEDF